MDQTPLNVALPTTRAGCLLQLAAVRDEIAAIKTQLAVADLERQTKRTPTDPRWFHRAKTALRHKQQQQALISARLASLPSDKDAFKDRLIVAARTALGPTAWQDVLATAQIEGDHAKNEAA